MRPLPIVVAAELALAVLCGACATTEEAGDRCRGRDAESHVEFDCASEEDDRWSEERRDEALEEMDERAPGGRP